MNSGQVIQLHLGQAGIQLGTACWELYCLEHGINLDGTMQCCNDPYRLVNTYYNLTGDGKVCPRLIMVDSEAVVIDEIKSGPFSKLFKCDALVSAHEDTGNNFARGYCTVSDELMDKTMDSIRRLSEECPALDGFFLFRALGGGTGSGFGTKLLERISDGYGSKIIKLEYSIFPSPCMSPVVVEPINSVLAIHGASELIDSSFIVSNEALYNIFEKKLFIECPTFANINRVMAQTISSITSGMRHDGNLGVGIRELETQLVPFPRIHYSIVSYSPLLPVRRPCHESFTAHKITSEALERNNTLSDVNLFDGLMMASILLYRGDLTSAEVAQEVQFVKSKIPTVSWSPSPVKTGLITCPPYCVPWGDLLQTPRSLCVLSNNTTFRNFLADLLIKYKTMIEKRAFLFHYLGEGLEESSLIEAGNNLCSLINEYEEYNSMRYGGGGAYDNGNPSPTSYEHITNPDSSDEMASSKSYFRMPLERKNMYYKQSNIKQSAEEDTGEGSSDFYLTSETSNGTKSLMLLPPPPPDFLTPFQFDD